MKHAFTGMMRVPPTAGLLDTRKGFSLPYKPKARKSKSACLWTQKQACCLRW